MRNTSAPQVAEMAARIREARAAAGMTTAQLAEACDVHFKTIDRWQHGRSAIPAHGIAAIADALDVDPTWLLVGDHSEVA